jgi:hypothetical protein
VATFTTEFLLFHRTGKLVIPMVVTFNVIIPIAVFYLF